MRIEVDRELAKLLDQVKMKEPTIYGRGHVETVRFLANYYVQHKPLQKLIEDLELNFTRFLENLNPNLERSLERVIPKALATTLTRILTIGGDAEETVKGPGPAAGRRQRVRSDATDPDVD